MKANLIDHEFDIEESAPVLPAWVLRENQLRNLLNAYSPYLELISSIDDDGEEYLDSYFPEFCQTSEGVKQGKPFTVWIYFKPYLSVKVATIYFDSVDRKYITNMLQVLFAYFEEAIDFVEVDEEDTKSSYAVKAISRRTH